MSGTQATAVGPPGKRTAEFSKIDNVWLIDNYEWGKLIGSQFAERQSQ